MIFAPPVAVLAETTAFLRACGAVEAREAGEAVAA